MLNRADPARPSRPRAVRRGRRSVAAPDPEPQVAVDEPCALVAAGLDEPLAGTAPETTGWVLIEHDGPWSPDAPGPAELGDVAARLGAHPRVRVQLIRRVRSGTVEDGSGPTAGHEVRLVHAGPDPAARWQRRLRVTDLAELRGLDVGLAALPVAPDLGEPVEHDVWLVCTHGRRDACCSRWGRPVAVALAAALGDRVWETTHTGGHRFAANLVLLPDGVVHAALDPGRALHVVAGHRQGRLHAASLRGRCALDRPAQAAEIAVRGAAGIDARDGLGVVGRERGVGGAHLIDLVAAAGGRWRVVVHDGPTGRPRPVSDGADPKDPGVREVVSVARVG